MSQTQTNNAKSLLQSLTAKKPAKIGAVKKASRPELELPDDLEQIFETYAGFATLAEVIDARLVQEKQLLEEEAFDLWVEKLWKSKSRPANPSLKKQNEEGKTDISAIFQVHERYVFSLPEVPEDSTPTETAINLFINLFSGLGMSNNDAEVAATNLVNNELDFTPKTFIDFNKFINGHYEGDGKNKTFIEASSEEKSIAEKVLYLLQCRTAEDLSKAKPLTDEETSSLIEQKYNVLVKQGFLQRVFTYVNTLEQLKVIFSVVRPVRYPSHVKFADSDSLESKNHRLLAVAKGILGL